MKGKFENQFPPALLPALARSPAPANAMGGPATGALPGRHVSPILLKLNSEIQAPKNIRLASVYYIGGLIHQKKSATSLFL